MDSLLNVKGQSELFGCSKNTGEVMNHSYLPKHVASLQTSFFKRSLRYSSSRANARRHLISEGRNTEPKDSPLPKLPQRSPWYLDTAYSIFAKRPTRPFPPPFVSYPSGSFSDPLTTHNRPRLRQAEVDGQLLRGITNGDDAIIIDGQNFLAVNDGVGAWAQKERGHAALWSRLIAHYWAAEAEKAFRNPEKAESDGRTPSLDELDTVKYLENAFSRTKDVTNFGKENEIMGTTTASSALLHHKSPDEPVVLATSLGDCAIMVIRPRNESMIYKSKEDWHWFDCPRQLGTNSPDTPTKNSFMDRVDVEEGDIVLCLSDGVTDNLWEEEITEWIGHAMKKWKANEKEAEDGIVYVARTIMNAAREIALDPYAGSPYMSRAVDEGLAAEGGKLDDISVVLGMVKRHKT
ncbi:hypothetical protein LTR64_002370 [Lithohypha guttulata]|uniref:Protein phosphatase n=1 Tax=Lithohypha guttulata TaxID=1690604 RepID=A0AAN7Y4Y5_9EURO|nr:hypothetical protein LTR51_001406 [Lithohypha guttulata]KAK5083446.1 hypothetical protein LTR05_005948 [Lithohypha guttulata]